MFVLRVDKIEVSPFKVTIGPKDDSVESIIDERGTFFFTCFAIAMWMIVS